MFTSSLGTITYSTRSLHAPPQNSLGHFKVARYPRFSACPFVRLNLPSQFCPFDQRLICVPADRLLCGLAAALSAAKSGHCRWTRAGAKGSEDWSWVWCFIGVHSFWGWRFCCHIRRTPKLGGKLAHRAETSSPSQLRPATHALFSSALRTGTCLVLVMEESAGNCSEESVSIMTT